MSERPLTIRKWGRGEPIGEHDAAFMYKLSSNSVFLLIIICFSSFVLGGGGGVRKGGARKEVFQVDLPYASQLSFSFLNINRYFLFCFR